MGVLEMSDVKLTDQFAGHENAGHEIGGYKSPLIQKMSKIKAEWA